VDKLEVIPHLLSDLLFAIMFFRVIYLARSVFNYSIYSDAYFKKLCKEYGFNPGVRFSLKCYLSLYPERTVIFLFFSTIFVLAYLLRIFEIFFLFHKTDYLPDNEN
jgi:hypothetical protein